MEEEIKLTEAESREAERYQKELADSLLAAADAMPPEEFEQMMQPAANELQSGLNTFAAAESQFGPQPEAWKAYEPQHGNIQEKLGNVASAYQTNQPQEARKNRALEASGAMQQSAGFFRQQYQQLLEQDRQMREEMKAMRKQLEEMRDLTRNYSPEEMAKAITVGMQFLQQVDTIRKDAKEQRAPATARLYQDAKDSVHEVYTNIKATPGRIKEAIKLKAYSAVDKGIQHVAGWFDRGISFIEKQKSAFLNLSPLEKERREKPPAKEPQQESKEPASASPKEAAAAAVPQEPSPQPEKAPAEEPGDVLISMKELLQGDTNKVIKDMVDFMVRSGGKEDDIVKAFTEMKAAAMTLVKQPEYSKIRAEAQDNAMQK